MLPKALIGRQGAPSNDISANSTLQNDRPYASAVQLKNSGINQWSGKIALIIFGLALTLRLAFVMVVPAGSLETDAKDYDTLGRRLAQGKGFVNAAGEPTAYRPPVYPLFLGMMYSVCGPTLTAIRLSQAFIGAGICVLAYFIAATTFSGRSAALAGFACSLYLPLIVHTSQILTETLFTFLLMLAVYLAISKPALSRLLISGVVFGLALLTRPMAVFFIPFWIYWLYLNPQYQTSKAVPVLLAGVLLIMVPWTIRNYCTLDAFVPFANVGGVTLYNSYVVPPQGFGYNSLVGVAREYFEIGSETERNRYLILQALGFIEAHPLQAIKLAAVKLLYFIYPFDGYWYQVSFGSKFNIFWGITMAFAAIGILSGGGTNNMNKILLIFLLLAFLVGVVVFYGSPRFRLPLEPILICLAAGAMVRLTQRNIYVPAIIVGLNVTLFALFHYVEFQNLFHHLKTWL